MERKLIFKLFLFCVLPILSFFVLTHFVLSEGTLSIDVKLAKMVYTLESPFLTSVMSLVSFLGSTGPVIVISLILMVVLYKTVGNRREILLFVVVSIGSVLLNILLKHLFQRERPSLIQIVAETGFSYPSGHSMAALSLYGITTFLFWKHIKKSSRRKLLIAASTMIIMTMGFSRVYLGVHYPTDIIGGYLISGFWLALTIFGYQYIQERRANKGNSKS